MIIPTKFLRIQFRFTLTALMLLLTGCAVWFAIYSHYHRQRMREVNAFIAITEKGVDAYQMLSDNVVIYFKNGNVADEDLDRFVPAFNEDKPFEGVGRITELQLNGSNVSDQAVKDFEKRVPWCKIVR